MEHDKFFIVSFLFALTFACALGQNNSTSSAPRCRANERYDPCANGNCSPKSCRDLGFPIACPSVSECKGACVCNDGYVRNNKGICIPTQQCPSCGGDRNAVSGCGSNCGKKCGDQNLGKPRPCPLFCIFNGCDCRNGFYYDSNTKQCVRPGRCTVN